MTAPSFDDFFARICQATDIENQSQLAQALGVGRAAISLAKQKNAVPWKWVFTLAETFHLNSNWLATGLGTPDPGADQDQISWVKIPHVQVISSPSTSGLEIDVLSAQIALSAPDTESDGSSFDVVSLHMIGPCMEPEIQDKDLVLLDQRDQTMRPGLIYAIDLENTLLIRRVDIHAQSVTLICDNQSFPPYHLSPDETQRLRVLGRVMGVLRLWKTFGEPG
jgi:hypothetical protein